MKSIYDYTQEQLIDEFLEMGEKKFRATQVFEWLYRKNVTTFDDMNNISQDLRKKLSETYTINLLTIKEKQVSSDGTIKYLFELNDGGLVESVLMVHDYGRSLCVTSQLGCNMGCKFCASGLLKKQRNLSAGEMVNQVLTVMHDTGERISHVVVMGTGEPFDNYDHVMNFVRVINHAKGLAIGARHITISTCGLCDKIAEYANEGIQSNLAISLHAPSDEIRDQIMPINKTYPMDVLRETLKNYIEKTNRRVTFEYILLKGINDQLAHARQLAHYIRGLNAYVNLIPYNAVDEHGFQQSSMSDVEAFKNELLRLKINVTLRKEHGRDIDGACGQLRAKKVGVIKVEIIAMTDIGNVRTVNQDYVRYYQKNDHECLVVLCDGMGGHNAGEIASQMTCDDIIEHYIHHDYFQDENDIQIWMQAVIHHAHEKVKTKSYESDDLEGMGTTVVLTLIKDDYAYISHVGDSRAYIYQADHLLQVTKDDTLVNVLIETGSISKEAAIHHPQKNILLQAVGVSDVIKVSYYKAQLIDGIILVCSDGLYNSLSESQLIDTLTQNQSLENKGIELMKNANKYGGKDNIGFALISRERENDNGEIK